MQVLNYLVYINIFFNKGKQRKTLNMHLRAIRYITNCKVPMTLVKHVETLISFTYVPKKYKFLISENL